MIENGIFKKRRNSRESSSTPPIKKIKKEVDDDYRNCNVTKSKNGLVHFGAQEEQDHLRGDFNWTSILNQDIEIGGVKVKTEDLLDSNSCDSQTPSAPMSPPSSECNSDDFSIEDLFAQTDLSNEPALDFTTNDPLDLTINGQHIETPGWWADNFNLSAIKSEPDCPDSDRSSGLHTPIAPSPATDGDGLDAEHPWAENGFADIGDAFDVDNLFDLENIPSPKLS